jgi:hypothetical protein
MKNLSRTPVPLLSTNILRKKYVSNKFQFTSVLSVVSALLEFPACKFTVFHQMAKIAKSHATCVHIDYALLPEYESVYQFLVRSRYRQPSSDMKALAAIENDVESWCALPVPSCSQCKSTAGILYACLECTNISCWPGHASEHNQSSGHTFGKYQLLDNFDF